MKQLDELIYDAICADDDLMDAIGGRVESTCFEVSPEEQDNTPVPYLIVTDDGFQNNLGTKDTIWEGDEDAVRATVEVAGNSPAEVKQLVKMVRRAVENHMVSLCNEGEDTPQLDSLQSQGIAWDWMKPCYYQHLMYNCTVNSTVIAEDESED